MRDTGALEKSFLFLFLIFIFPYILDEHGSQSGSIGNAARQASRYLLCSLASFRGSAVESDIWVRPRARVCGKHFLCRNAAIGKEAERL